jgi:hypothetical protein
MTGDTGIDRWTSAGDNGERERTENSGIHGRITGGSDFFFRRSRQALIEMQTYGPMAAGGLKRVHQ